MTDTPGGWREFFDAHAPEYMKNVFTQNTEAVVAFLVEQLGLTPGMPLLDVGCGTGRHSVRLAERGLRMWGGAGSWGRRPLEWDEYEVMVVARKPAWRARPVP